MRRSGDPFKHLMVGKVETKRYGKGTITFTCQAFNHLASTWYCSETKLHYTNSNKTWINNFDFKVIRDYLKKKGGLK